MENAEQFSCAEDDKNVNHFFNHFLYSNQMHMIR
jgi:hypothetical protein